jgi:hypothetical protein
VRAARLYLITVIGVALLATGTLPPEHLHHSTATRPQVVHNHFGYGRSLTGPPHPCSLCVDDDDHDAAVEIGHVIATGPQAHVSGQPALLPASLALPTFQLVVASVPVWDPDEAPSPPPRPTAPRAPPA